MTETEMSRVEKAREAVQALTDNEFADHRRWCALDEQERRTRESGAREQAITMNRMLRDAGMVPPPPEAWEPAHPPTLAWLPGDETTHNGARWVSVLEGLNEQTPGEGDGWQVLRDLTDQEDAVVA